MDVTTTRPTRHNEPECEHAHVPSHLLCIRDTVDHMLTLPVSHLKLCTANFQNLHDWHSRYTWQNQS